MDKYFGAKIAPTPVREYAFDLCCAAQEEVELPDEYELPAALLPPVYDQKATNKCVAFTLCECAEAETIKRGKQTRLSPSWTYGRDEGRKGYKGEGMYADDAVAGAVKTGFVPYLYFQFDDMDVPDVIGLAEDRDDLLELGEAVRPSAYVGMNYAMESKRWESIKRAIYVYQRPVVIISHRYFGGSHAIMAYGYTDSMPKANGKGTVKGRFVKFQNSWGTDWEDGGRSLIPFGSIDDVYMLCWEEIKLPFTDVAKDEWFYEEVKAAYLADLMQGVTKTEFAPNDNIIRGDVALMLSRLFDKFSYSVNSFVKTEQQEGKKAKSITLANGGGIPFADVKDGDYYRDAVSEMYANGIMEGVSGTAFEPQTALTRAEAAALVARVLEKMKALLDQAMPYKKCTLPNNAAAEPFSDVDAGAWYFPYVEKAIRYGLMQGNGDNTFAPDNNIIRAEAATIFNRLFKATDGLLAQLA